MGERFVFEVWQDGGRVAAVDGPDRYRAMAEAGHYALVYGQDGPVKVFEKIGRKRVPVVTNGTREGAA